MICMEEEIGEGFRYSFRCCNRYLKKHISKNFAALAFKERSNIFIIDTKHRVPIREVFDGLYVDLFKQKTDLSLLHQLHHSIRKV